MQEVGERFVCEKSVSNFTKKKYSILKRHFPTEPKRLSTREKTFVSKKEQVKQNKALLKAVENEDIAALEASISAGADVNYGHPEVVGEGDG